MRRKRDDDDLCDNNNNDGVMYYSQRVHIERRRAFDHLYVEMTVTWHM